MNLLLTLPAIKFDLQPLTPLPTIAPRSEGGWLEGDTAKESRVSDSRGFLVVRDGRRSVRDVDVQRERVLLEVRRGRCL